MASAGSIELGYTAVHNPLHSGVSEAYLRSRENARKRCENSAEVFEARDPPETIGVRTFWVTVTVFILGLVILFVLY
jgi:uncharacterized membrane protein